MLEKSSGRVLLGIDGCGGSGKSTFARRLVDALAQGGADSQIIHMDDFYKPSVQRLPQCESLALIGSDFDWQRLRRDVLKPLSENKSGHYQRYDWPTDTLAEWHEVQSRGIIVVEGIYSTRYELDALYDLTFWLYCSRSERLDRGVARDGESKRDLWEKFWMPAEDRYVELDEPHRRAKMLVDGSGSTDQISLRCDLDSLFAASNH